MVIVVSDAVVSIDVVVWRYCAINASSLTH